MICSVSAFRTAVVPAALLWLFCAVAHAQSGFVRSGSQPLPGATVSLAQGTQTASTVTDADGHYGFALLPPGTWTVRIEMFGFDPLQQDVNFSNQLAPVNFDLHLTEPAYLRRMAQSGTTRGNSNAQNPASQPGALDSDLQNALNDSSAAPSSAPSSSASGANETFLVAGSLSPGTAEGAQPDFAGGPPPGGLGAFGDGRSPGESNPVAGFPGTVPGSGQPGGFGGGGGGRGGGIGGPGGFGGPGGGGRGSRGDASGRRRAPGGAVFGNARRRNQTIHGQASFTLANSAVNAQPFSINGLNLPQASYAQSRFSFIVGGPLVIPKLLNDRKTQFFLTYFGTRSRTPELFTRTVPTTLERNGDFSQSVQSLGSTATTAPVVVYDPTTRQPYPNNRIPSTALNPIAQAFLRFYPAPNQSSFTNNYQAETTQVSNSITWASAFSAASLPKTAFRPTSSINAATAPALNRSTMPMTRRAME